MRLFLFFLGIFLSGTLSSQSTKNLKRVELGVNLSDYVITNDTGFNKIRDAIYERSVLNKLYPPLPPSLPNCWFSPGGVYVGQWVWDTMFQLIAFAPLNQDTVIRNVFENYWNAIDKNPEAPKGSFRYGMVPNFINPQNWPPLGYSQIPILGWGCWSIYQQTNDIELIKRAFPYLELFDRWYSTERDIDQDELIEFGAYKPIGTSDILQTARYETFDFNPAMDDMQLTVNPNHESGNWYGNVEGVEQTCFLILQEQAIVKIALILGEKDRANFYQKLVEKRINAVRAKMWDPKTQFFYSLDRDSDKKIMTKNLMAFLTLTCGAATNTQAEALLKHLTNPNEFWSKLPVPTCSLDDPKYDTKIGKQPQLMWRGDVWPATNYFVSMGLQKYGYRQTAEDLTNKMLEIMKLNGINERYDPKTGLGLGVKDLGMSCSIWSMVVQQVYGIQDDYRTIIVPQHPERKKLKLGKIELSYPTNNSLELKSSFEREFSVILPDKGKKTIGLTCDGNVQKDFVWKTNCSTLIFKAKPEKSYRIKWE